MPRLLLRDLFVGLPPAQRGRRLVLSLQVYVDESGGINTSRTFVMSGLMASVETWDAFGREWDQVLAQSPRLEYFKMSEAVTLGGQFRGWSESTRDERLRQLADLALKYKLIQFIESMDLRSFTHFSLKQMLPKPANSPYFFSFHRMISIVARHLCESGHNEQFEIFFDIHKIFGHKARRFYPLIKILKKGTLEYDILPTDPIFRDDANTYPLQIADMTAWLLRDIGEGNWHWLLDRLEPIECYSHITTVDDMLNLARSEVTVLTPEQWKEWQSVMEDSP
jgi:hypothetical protein